jgi:hypothetical protein
MNEHRYNKGDVVYTRPGLNNSLGDDYAGSGYEENLKLTIISTNKSRDFKPYYITIDDVTDRKRIIFECAIMSIAEKRDLLINNIFDE